MKVRIAQRETPDETDSTFLQRAIDAAAAGGGGSVRIPAGVYELQDALRLRDGVRVVGEPGTLLRPMRRRSGLLTHIAGFGMHEFQVQNPEDFEIGMGVLLMDDNARGYYMTAATIVGRNGDVFYTDRPMAHDYNPRQGACVVSVFPLLFGWEIRNAEVSGLALSGHPDDPWHARAANGCRNGGVFLLRSRDVRLHDLEISHYNGDGISFQLSKDISVRNCRIHHNQACGLHPGSGSVRYEFVGNTIEHNGEHGIFYCLRTTHSLCEKNTIRGNAKDGISIGERDTDHLTRENVLTGNGAAGLAFREPVVQSGDRVRVENNVFEDNGSPEGEIVVAAGLSDLSFIGNEFSLPQSRAALSLGEHCRNISLSGNRVRGGRPLEDGDLRGDRAAVSFLKVPEAPPFDLASPVNTDHLALPEAES